MSSAIQVVDRHALIARMSDSKVSHAHTHVHIIRPLRLDGSLLVGRDVCTAVGNRRAYGAAAGHKALALHLHLALHMAEGIGLALLYECLRLLLILKRKRLDLRL